MFEIKKNPKQVFICGTGSGWEAVPKESSATIYCLNDFIRTERYGVKMDKLFVMDILDEKPQIISGVDDLSGVIKRINDIGVPLIAPCKYEEVPLSEAFPIEECVKRFGQPYFSNTICYMIAYAIMQGAEEIETFGVNQASSSEYSMEKAGVEYWLGIAVGLGIKVTIHGEKSELLTSKTRWGAGLLYGYNLPYEEIIRINERMGGNVVKKLKVPPKDVARTIRQIN
jgi:hypothetical protein